MRVPTLPSRTGSSLEQLLRRHFATARTHTAADETARAFGECMLIDCCCRAASFLSLSRHMDVFELSRGSLNEDDAWVEVAARVVRVARELPRDCTTASTNHQSQLPSSCLSSSPL